LLAADAGISDDEIARSVGAGGSTVYRTQAAFRACGGGVQATDLQIVHRQMDHSLSGQKGKVANETERRGSRTGAL